MARRRLDDMRIAVLTADGFEQVEVTRPVKALEKHGAEVEIVSLRPGTIQGMKLLVPGEEVRVDRTVAAADPDDYDALYIPGGFIAPDFIRQSERSLEFVRAFDAEHKPIATICHGPWVLISAGLVEGRRLTSWPGVRDDVRNAGGEWVNEAVVVDDNWISSRGPQDLRGFDRAIVEHLASHEAGVAASGTGGAQSEIGGIGSWLVGAAAVAAAGLALQRTRRAVTETGNGRTPEAAVRTPDLEEETEGYTEDF
jgi:protease I